MNPKTLARVARPLIDLALAEDIGLGDASSDGLIPPEHQSKAVITAREDLVLAGLPIVDAVCRAMDPELSPGPLLKDGTRVHAGDPVWECTGSTQILLQIERTALNFLQMLSGIATTTARYVEAAQRGNARIRVCDTRKTIPGYRVLSKYAVRCGGGHNHRFSLADVVMLKDNHIAICGSITEAIQAIRQHTPHTASVVVEADTLDQAREAAGAGADIVLLDNMQPDQLKTAVEELGEKVILEASGGISLESIESIAATGVDVISVGGITHSAPAVDLSMSMEKHS